MNASVSPVFRMATLRLTEPSNVSSPAFLKAVYELKLMGLSGFQPDTDGCAGCGKDENKDRDKCKQRFSAARLPARSVLRTVFGVVHTACLPSLTLCLWFGKDVDPEAVAV